MPMTRVTARTRLALLLTPVVGTAVALTATVLTAPPGTARLADPAFAAGAGRPDLLKPNVVVLKANKLYVQHTGAGRKLRFESALGNVGRGPIEVRPNRNRKCPPGKQHASQIIYQDKDGRGFFSRSVDTRVSRRSAGCMVYHPHHDHWHFEATSRYSIYRPRHENIVVARRKMSFCLRDSERIPAKYGSWNYPVYYGACSRHSPQGISIGWVDVYQNFLAGQALRMPAGMRNGTYCLQIRVDPLDALVETDDTDNTSVRAFRLTGDSVRFRSADPCRAPRT